MTTRRRGHAGAGHGGHGGGCDYEWGGPMTAIIEVQYNDHKFMLLVNSAPREDGVIVSPSADRDAEDFTDALDWALMIFPYVRAESCLLEFGDYIIHGETRIHEEDEVARLVIHAYENEIIRVNPRALEVAKSILSGVKLKRPDSSYPKKPRKRDGYVYLLKAETGHYKIGRTVNPDNRQKTFSVKLPFKVEYTCLIKCDDMITLEEELHAHYADKRIDGEWFALTTDDVEYIKGLAS